MPPIMHTYDYLIAFSRIHIISWLLNSMTTETGENFMYYKTAKEIWDAARETYSNKDNTSAIFEIKGILHDLK